MKIRHFLMLALASAALCSCNTTKTIPYLIDADQLSPEALRAAAKVAEPVIMPGDMLQIYVMGHNTEAVKPFNKTDVLGDNVNQHQSNNQNNSIYNYLVDNDGNIEFPVLGSLHVGGMTAPAVQELISSRIYPRYVTEKPSVEVRFQNFRVYFIGEVGHGVVEAPNGRLNILEALAQSGDLGIQGRRDNIMVIRTNSDGSRQVKRINLNDKNLLLSPDFYLQQNDIVYVQPNESKARSSWQLPPAVNVGLLVLSTAITITNFAITLSK